MYVTQYTVTREYGGPQEGGWWYDWYEFDSSDNVNRSQDDAITISTSHNTKEKARKQQEGLPDRFSVNGGPDVEYLVEDVVGENTGLHPITGESCMYLY